VYVRHHTLAYHLHLATYSPDLTLQLPMAVRCHCI